jgi:hypothetical protein
MAMASCKALREMAMKIHFSGKCEVTRAKTSPLFEIASVLVRLGHVASIIVNANHSIM